MKKKTLAIVSYGVITIVLLRYLARFCYIYYICYDLFGSIDS